LGRRWSSWEQVDEKQRWMQKKEEGDKEVVVDLMETFFTNLSL